MQTTTVQVGENAVEIYRAGSGWHDCSSSGSWSGRP